MNKHHQAPAARLTVVTIGVSNLEVSRAFYERGLGFHVSSSSTGDVVFMQGGGVVLALYPRTLLADDAHLEDLHAKSPGFGGITLAWNVASEAEADAGIARAQEAGAKVLKPAQKVFWGGYSGYFADLDGYPWEVAFNPFWEFNAEGVVQLPE